MKIRIAFVFIYQFVKKHNNINPSALRGGQRGTVGHDLVLDVHLARVVEQVEEALHGGRGGGQLLDAGQVVRLVVVNALEVLLINGRLLLCVASPGSPAG